MHLPTALAVVLLLLSLADQTLSVPSDLVLTQSLVTIDLTTEQWHEDSRAPDNQWTTSDTDDVLVPLMPFDENWDGYLVYFQTSCPETLSTSNFASINNRTVFAENLQLPLKNVSDDEEEEVLLPRIGLMSRGGSCSWSTKVSHALSISRMFNMTLYGIIMYNNQSTLMTVPHSLPENNLIPVLLDIPILFVSRRIGLTLLDTLYYANQFPETSLQDSLFFSKAFVYYQPSSSVGSVVQVKEEDSWIFAGQWIVNSIVITLIVGLMAYGYHRFKKRRSSLDNNTSSSLSPSTTIDNELPISISSTISSFLAIMRRRGEPDDITLDNGNKGIGWEQLEKYPPIKYDPLLVRNPVCAICLDDFKLPSTEDPEKLVSKTVRRLRCGHGFCVPCIGQYHLLCLTCQIPARVKLYYTDPWLSMKSRNCPLCKQDCTESVPKPEPAYVLPTVHSSRMSQSSSTQSIHQSQ